MRFCTWGPIVPVIFEMFCFVTYEMDATFSRGPISFVTRDTTSPDSCETVCFVTCGPICRVTRWPIRYITSDPIRFVTWRADMFRYLQAELLQYLRSDT